MGFQPRQWHCFLLNVSGHVKQNIFMNCSVYISRVYKSYIIIISFTPRGRWYFLYKSYTVEPGTLLIDRPSWKIQLNPMQGREVVLHACCHCGFQTQLLPTMDLTTTSPEALHGRICQGRQGCPEPGKEPGLQRAWQTKPCKPDSTLPRWWRTGCEASGPQGWSSPGEGLGVRLPCLSRRSMRPRTVAGHRTCEHKQRNRASDWCHCQSV